MSRCREARNNHAKNEASPAPTETRDNVVKSTFSIDTKIKNKNKNDKNDQAIAKTGARMNKDNKKPVRPSPAQGSNPKKQGKQATSIPDYIPNFDPTFPAHLTRKINPSNADPSLASFVDLPLELRIRIYSLIFAQVRQRVKDRSVVWRPGTTARSGLCL